MNTPLILKISAVIALGALPAARAAADKKLPPLGGTSSTDSPAGTGIACTSNGKEGTVTFKQKQVWKGKVRKQINAIAKMVDGDEIAAAWDGKKLVWENVAGAGAKLKPDLRDLLKKQRNLPN